MGTHPIFESDFDCLTALGVLRQDENRQPKIWKTLDVDPERQMLPIKEFRGRMTGTTPTFTQVTLPEIRPETAKRSKSAPRIDRSSSWYQHAKSGFKYWDGTKDKYKPSDPVKTRFSMGDRFNPGRLGVRVDRVYSSGSTNYHYWSSFESKMTPIGSGKTLAEVKRYY